MHDEGDLFTARIRIRYSAPFGDSFAMARLLAILLIAAFAWYLYRRLQATHPASRPGRHTEDTVKCAHCGVYLPARDALHEGSRAWCCEAHHRLDQSRHE